MKLAIVGAGAGGTKLIELFHEVKEVEIVSVIDKNLQSPGIAHAKKYGIPFYTDIEKIDHRADTIIEATGSPKVLEMIKSHFGHSKRIIESDVAQLLMFVIDRQVEMRQRLNFQLEEINKTSLKLHDEMNKIVSITKDLNVINDELANSAEHSKQFIEQTDEMTRAVNKITQQIKILGLNANIEAARAGEHGRGFSVVATEVQKMSDTTSDFATQISDLLKSLKDENEKISLEISKLNDISGNQDAITSMAKNIVDELKNI